MITDTQTEPYPAYTTLKNMYNMQLLVLLLGCAEMAEAAAEPCSV